MFQVGDSTQIFCKKKQTANNSETQRINPACAAAPQTAKLDGLKVVSGTNGKKQPEL